MLLTAMINSTILTVASVAVMVILAAMVGYVLQRRRGWWTPLANFLILAGLIVPPAVVPTIWLMQKLGIYKTLHGLVLIEVAFGLSFSVLLFRAFVATIPRELDEAATIDGAGPLRLFFGVIFPLLRSVIVTVIVVQAVAVFNDFQNPLYFLPGNDNATVQLTLFNFQSQFNTMRNLLFTDILLITIPPLHHVHVLQPPDRRRADLRRRQGLRLERKHMTPTVTSVRLEYRSDSGIVGVPRPRASWKVATDAPGWTQASAEIEWSAGPDRQTATVAGHASHLVAVAVR